MARYINRKGLRYGDLIVLRKSRKSVPRIVVWECRCISKISGRICGNITNVRSCHLGAWKHSTKHCSKCSRIQTSITKSKMGPREGKSKAFPPGFNAFYHNLQINAKRRGLALELTREQVFVLCSKPCSYCGQKGVNILGRSNFRYNGIDRKDNTKGYTLGNCIPCCGPHNRMKGTMPKREFIRQVRLITKYLF